MTEFYVPGPICSERQRELAEKYGNNYIAAGHVHNFSKNSSIPIAPSQNNLRKGTPINRQQASRFKLSPKVAIPGGAQFTAFKYVKVGGVFLPVIPGGNGKNLATRRSYVKKGGGAIFEIEENPKADGTEPWYEQELFGINRVKTYDSAIKTAANKYSVDPDIIRSIMYMEESHGYYDEIPDLVNKNHTIRPMNVDDNLWGYTHQQLEDPTLNIDVGTWILAGIQANLLPKDRTVDKIATLYNMLSASKVIDYGARVNAIYISKPWIRKVSPPSSDIPGKLYVLPL